MRNTYLFSKNINKDNLSIYYNRLKEYSPISKKKLPEETSFKPTKELNKSQLLIRFSSVINSIKDAHNFDSRNKRFDELTILLLKHPFLKYYAIKNNIIGNHCIEYNKNKHVSQLLTVLGYTPPLIYEGVRILSIDGGGSRGLISLQILNEIQKLANQPIHELFDFICGTSTGALIACLIGLKKMPPESCIDLYKELSKELFVRNKFIGAGNLVWSHSYYDSETLIKALKKQFQEIPLLATALFDSPKVALISTVVNTPIPKPFVFRNYGHPLDKESLYPGTFDATVWQACQASASAPGYFEACKFGPYILQDGGVLMNNPAPIAVHESKLLWPREKVQCIVSLGNGRFNPFDRPLPLESYSSLRAKLSKMAQFISDTEGTHSILSDVLPYNYYYRLNPCLTRELSLDEKDPDNLTSMMDDATRYVERNSALFEKLVIRLKSSRKISSVTRDAIQMIRTKLLTFV